MLVLSGCGAAEAPAPDAATGAMCTPREPGWLRLYVQGASGVADADGVYPLVDDRRLVLPGDHFLLSVGSYVEASAALPTHWTGRLRLHVARDDDPGVVGRYEVLRRSHGVDTILYTTDDSARGNKGRTPFDHDLQATPPAGCDDSLVLRVTNLSGGRLGVVVVPPDYMTWLDVEISQPLDGTGSAPDGR